MFEKAARLKLRYDTGRGRLSVEDLWDLPLLSNKHGVVCLDDVAKELHREMKDSDEESFVIQTSEPNEELKLKFEIVKHIIRVRLAEEAAKKNAALIAEKKQQIMAIMVEKETETLKGSSLEELRALLAAL